ncbi:hypothetical protein KORDIASMS9_03385 [Kordia sp. SMS9]|uniref:hypothetical protein n=1 Tax=Kordia sp. SMS9 TaxID=2282170 RepID=UPI000E0CD195|nr:hypothetical protein [Kordia sp. SMS9]AXG71130.1 hypothetical protein KORDIASMS9_03385 [Kordia sp. SMS9]
MHAITPFKNIISSHLDEEVGLKNATGLVKDWETLINPEKIETIKENYPGAIIFIAIDNNIDVNLFDYIIGEELENKSGNNILILFMSNSEFETPDILDVEEIKELLEIKYSQSIIHEILKAYFNDTKYFNLPGILIFDKKKFSKNGIYVPLMSNDDYQELNLKKQISLLYKNIEITTNTYFKSKDDNFLSKLGVQLTKNKIQYIKSTKISFGEYLVKVLQKIYELKGDIISIVK